MGIQLWGRIVHSRRRWLDLHFYPLIKYLALITLTVRLCDRPQPPLTALLLEPLTLGLKVDHAPLLPLLERPRPHDDRSLGKLGRGILVEEVLVPDGLEEVVEHERGGRHQLSLFVA